VTYFVSVRGDDMKICSLSEIPCLSNHADYIRMLSFPTEEVEKELHKAGLQCNCLGSEKFYVIFLVFSIVNV